MRIGDCISIPTDITLSRYIRELIQTDKLYKFYKSKEWIELRQDVLQEHHYECQVCSERGRYTRADCVHHINEVKNRPDLALQRALSCAHFLGVFQIYVEKSV